MILRLYSWESEGRDFIRRFAKVGRHVQRMDDDNTGGILMTLLNAFSDKAHEFDREGRKARSSNDSIVTRLSSYTRPTAMQRNPASMTH